MSYESTMPEIGSEGTVTALQLVSRSPRNPKTVVLTNDYGWFQWDEASTASQSTGLVYKVSDITTGRWLAVASLALDSETVANALLDVTGRVSIHKVRGRSTANIADLTTFTVAGVDGLTYAAGERILLMNQSTGAENGIYVVGTVGGGTAALTRATDWPAALVLPTGTMISVDAGTTHGNTLWYVSNTGDVTVATTTPTFIKVIDATTLAATGGAALAGIAATTSFSAATTVEGAVAALAQGSGTVGLAATHRVRGVTEANQANLAAFVISNDGLTYAQGDRILLAGQTTGAENGIYVVGAVAGTAPLTRAVDWAAAAVIPTGTLIAVDAGTLGANSLWMVDNTGDVTVATTTPTFRPLAWYGVQALSGPGAILLTSPTTRFTSTGVDDGLTLADGAASRIGQRKRIFHAVDGGNGLLTAGGSLHLGDGISTIKLNTVRDFVELEWNGTSWFVVADRGAAYT